MCACTHSLSSLIAAADGVSSVSGCGSSASMEGRDGWMDGEGGCVDGGEKDG